VKSFLRIVGVKTSEVPNEEVRQTFLGQEIPSPPFF